ncbi:MAG: hypothetical protein EHM83_08025 [Burkholderiales bacterium]|nr:MAG: hypothetical protein EHM83_08025 [Burkholderiales bacterium]
MRTNYVLLDYENVQPAAMSALDAEHFRVQVFVGPGQSKVSFEIASALQRMGPRAEYIRVSAPGRNALDFHIAFHLGQLALREPDAFFHIISRDTGFDPLIAHLKTLKVFACRSADITEMPIVKAAQSQPVAERAEAVVANLRKRGAALPRSVTTLTKSIGALFQTRDLGT